MLVAVATGSSTPAGRRGPRSGAAGSGSRRTCRCRRLVKGVVLVVVQEPHQAGRRGWGQAELAASKRHAGDAPAVRWGRRHAVGMDRSEDRDVVLPKLAFTIKEAERSTGISAATITRAIHTTDPWSFPPPLHAKRAGSRYLVLSTDLIVWLESFRDADDEPYGAEPRESAAEPADPLARSVRSRAYRRR